MFSSQLQLPPLFLLRVVSSSLECTPYRDQTVYKQLFIQVKLREFLWNELAVQTVYLRIIKFIYVYLIHVIVNLCYMVIFVVV